MRAVCAQGLPGNHLVRILLGGVHRVTVRSGYHVRYGIFLRLVGQDVAIHGNDTVANLVALH